MKREVNRKHCSQKLCEAAGLTETKPHLWGQLWRAYKGQVERVGCQGCGGHS